MNGDILNYTSQEVGATVTYICDDGFRPSQVLMSICANTSLWTPPPDAQNCTFVVGKIYLI